VLATELDTAPAMRPRSAARPSMKKLTVDPVPTPTMPPLADAFQGCFRGPLLPGILDHGGCLTPETTVPAFAGTVVKLW